MACAVIPWMFQLATLVTFAVGIPITHAARAADAARPNIVLIYTDDQGFGDASCLNDKSKFYTPNLDHLAREGLTFTDAHCSDTVCTPSRYGLLTGRYSWRTHLKRGVFGAEAKCLIDDGRITLASLAKQAGYRTAMVGKWHLGMDFPGEKGKRDWSQPTKDMPLDKGFDFYFGIPASMNYGVLAWFEGRFPQTPPVLFTQKKPNRIALSDYRIMPPYDSKLYPNGRPAQAKKAAQRLEVSDDFVDSECLTRFTDRAIQWMTAHVKSGDQPFFLYLPYTSPHKPVIPIQKFRGESDAGAYGDFMLETDWHIGRIMAALQSLEIDDDTMVIFSSDNGPENTWKQRAEKYSHQSNGIYRDGKRSVYEGGHRVPFFIRWPRGIESPGCVVEQPICQTDILATLAQLWAVTLPDNAAEDSISFWSVLRRDHRSQTKVQSNSTEPRPPIIHHGASGRFAIRHGQWKLVMPGGGQGKSGRNNRMELYNLNDDPGESENVLKDHEDVAKRLQDKLTKIVREGRSSPGKPQKNDTPWWTDLHWMSKAEYE